MFLSRLFLFILSVNLFSCSKPNNDHYKALDGDSFIIVTQNNSNTRYDLAYIDAPEREQPYGFEAKKYLSNLLLDDNLEVVTLSNSLVELYINEQSVNLTMVEEGLSWASPQISNPKIRHQYILAQKRAADNLKGIWGLEHGLMIAPWQWRSQGKERSTNLEHQRQLLLNRKKQQEYNNAKRLGQKTLAEQKQQAKNKAINLPKSIQESNK